MSQTWAHSVLNGMAKPVMLSLFPSRAQIVNVSCGSCGEQLAMVTESANGPWLTTANTRRDHAVVARSMFDAPPGRSAARESFVHDRSTTARRTTSN